MWSHESYRKSDWLILAACLLCTCSGENHWIDPTVDLWSCLQGTIQFRISDCEAGGLVYILNRGFVYNVQPSQNGTMIYTCSFDDCSVYWNEQFTFVLQRTPLVQTSYDVRRKFVCLADQASLVTWDTKANRCANKTRCLYHVTFSAMCGTIGCQQTIASGLFDINIRSCDASGISLIEARCPVDGALFRGFNKTSRGVVVNSFAMFRTTSMRREPVSMMFSCVLEVCYAPCVEYICDGTEAVAMVPRWRRTAGGVAREVSLTTIFSVGMEALPTSVVLPCEGISRVIAVSVLAAVSALWLSSISVATYYLREWRSITHRPGSDSGQRDHEKSTNRETIQGHI